MAQVIVSRENKLYKKIKSLKQKKYREQYDRFLIEGTKMVGEALAWQMPMTHLVYIDNKEEDQMLHDLVNRCERMGIPCIALEHRLFHELCDTDSPQGILAVMERKESNLTTLLQKETLKLLLLDRIQDPGNLGTMIRTADAFGIDGVVLSKGCVDLYNPKVLRATMGSIFHLPIFEDENLTMLSSLFKEQDVQIIATDPYGDILLSHVVPKKKRALVIGNEANGISDSLKALSDCRAKIPMNGNAESLNASIAAAIAIYELSK